MKKHITRIISVVTVITLFLISPITTKAQENTQLDYWNYSEGQQLKWQFFDDYYLIDNVTANTDSAVSSGKNYSLDKCYLTYDVAKEWGSGDLNLEILSHNPSVDKIVVNVSYFPMTAPELSYVREWHNYTTSAPIVTDIPSLIDIDYVPPNGKAYFQGLGSIWVSGINITQLLNQFMEEPLPPFVGDLLSEDFDFGSLPTTLINLFGMAEVSFYSGESKVLSSSYMYEYNEPDYIKSPWKTYDLVGLSAEIVHEEDYITDIDDNPDLMVMMTNYLEAYGQEAHMPMYFDFNQIIGFLTSVAGLAWDIVHLIDSDDNETNGVQSIIPPVVDEYIDIPPYLAMSIPSGMKITYSDSAYFLENIYGLGTDFIDYILLPVISGSSPSLESFLGAILNTDMSFMFVISSIFLFSLTNVLMFPKDFDLNVFTDGFEYFDNQMENILPSVFSNTEYENNYALWHSLRNLFDVSEEGNVLSMTIGHKAFPMIFDTIYGHTGLEMYISWDTDLNILKDFWFEIDCPLVKYSHNIGMRFIELDDNEEKSGWSEWIGSIGGLLTVIGSSLGIFTVAVVYRKKKRAHVTNDVKKVLQYANCDDPDTCCDGEFCDRIL